MNQRHSLTCSDYYQHLMQPIEGAAPCGYALDYDPGFIMLQSRLQPKLGVEYGSFYEAAEPINWTEAERDCLALLQKSKDVRLIVILMRCRLRKAGLSALAEGAEALCALLKAWPNDLHPQLLDEGEFAPMLRANAFSELEDAGGLLADLRSQPLPKASGLQITVREFEKAHQLPREEGALSDAAVSTLVHEWHDRAREEMRPLAQAYYFVQEIRHTLAEIPGNEVPELALLLNILEIFSRQIGNDAPVVETLQTPLCVIPDHVACPVATRRDITDIVEVAYASPLAVPQPDLPQAQSGIHSRADALYRLQEVRHWFAMTEPSSPLVQILKYAENSIGKNFADLLKMYPAEIVAILNPERNK